jgi:hypothetical protein
MRKLLSAAVFGIATAFLAAPGAMAAEGPSISVQDHDVKAGQAVAVVASCDSPNFTGSKVTSTVLESEDLGSTDPGEKAFAAAHVKPGTKPGHYALSFTCNGRNVSGAFDVRPGTVDAASQGDELPTADQSDAVDDTVVAAAVSQNTNYSLFIWGGAGVLVLSAAGFLLVRRARRQR